ncbi:hypothetical protein M406DRAFT_355453, partial [Cryphonectria parasitica EP155]
MKPKGGARNSSAPIVGQQPPASPTGKGAKYRNRDGSKFITLPETTSAPSSAQPSPTAGTVAPANTPISNTPLPPASNGPAAAVNRKKQKRREKERAKAAAAAAVNGASNPPSPAGHRPSGDPDPVDYSDEGNHLDSQFRQTHGASNGHVAESTGKPKKS